MLYYPMSFSLRLAKLLERNLSQKIAAKSSRVRIHDGQFRIRPILLFIIYIRDRQLLPDTMRK